MLPATVVPGGGGQLTGDTLNCPGVSQRDARNERLALRAGVE